MKSLAEALSPAMPSPMPPLPGPGPEPGPRPPPPTPPPWLARTTTAEPRARNPATATARENPPLSREPPPNASPFTRDTPSPTLPREPPTAATTRAPPTRELLLAGVLRSAALQLQLPLPLPLLLDSPTAADVVGTVNVASARFVIVCCLRFVGLGSAAAAAAAPYAVSAHSASRPEHV